MSQFIVRSLNLALVTAAALGLSRVAHAQTRQTQPSAPGAPPVYLVQTAPAAPGVQVPAPGQPIQVVYATSPSGTPINGQTTVYYVQNAAPPAAPVSEPAPSTAASVQTAALAPQENDASGPEEPNYLELRQRGVDFYVGVGGSFATGSFDDDDQFPVSDASVGAVTATLGVGYRFSPHIYAGGYVEGGVGPLNTSETFDFCDDDSDIECTAGLVRYGIEGRYTFNPEDRTAFWLGAGLGGNVFAASAKVKGGRSLARVTANGTELLLKGGINVAVAKKATMDVFVGVSRGSFDKVEITVLDESAHVVDPGSSGWISVGAAFVL